MPKFTDKIADKLGDHPVSHHLRGRKWGEILISTLFALIVLALVAVWSAATAGYDTVSQFSSNWNMTDNDHWFSHFIPGRTGNLCEPSFINTGAQFYTNNGVFVWEMGKAFNVSMLPTGDNSTQVNFNGTLQPYGDHPLDACDVSGLTIDMDLLGAQVRLQIYATCVSPDWPALLRTETIYSVDPAAVLDEAMWFNDYITPDVSGNFSISGTLNDLATDLWNREKAMFLRASQQAPIMRALRVQNPDNCALKSANRTTCFEEPVKWMEGAEGFFLYPNTTISTVTFDNPAFWNATVDNFVQAAYAAARYDFGSNMTNNIFVNATARSAVIKSDDGAGRDNTTTLMNQLTGAQAFLGTPEYTIPKIGKVRTSYLCLVMKIKPPAAFAIAVLGLTFALFGVVFAAAAWLFHQVTGRHIGGVGPQTVLAPVVVPVQQVDSRDPEAQEKMAREVAGDVAHEQGVEDFKTMTPDMSRVQTPAPAYSLNRSRSRVTPEKAGSGVHERLLAGAAGAGMGSAAATAVGSEYSPSPPLTPAAGMFADAKRYTSFGSSSKLDTLPTTNPLASASRTSSFGNLPTGAQLAGGMNRGGSGAATPQMPGGAGGQLAGMAVGAAIAGAGALYTRLSGSDLASRLSSRASTPTGGAEKSSGYFSRWTGSTTPGAGEGGVPTTPGGGLLSPSAAGFMQNVTGGRISPKLPAGVAGLAGAAAGGAGLAGLAGAVRSASGDAARAAGLPTSVPSVPGVPAGLPAGMPTGVPAGVPTGVPSAGAPAGVPVPNVPSSSVPGVPAASSLDSTPSAHASAAGIPTSPRSSMGAASAASAAAAGAIAFTTSRFRNRAAAAAPGGLQVEPPHTYAPIKGGDGTFTGTPLVDTPTSEKFQSVPVMAPSAPAPAPAPPAVPAGPAALSPVMEASPNPAENTVPPVNYPAPPHVPAPGQPPSVPLPPVPSAAASVPSTIRAVPSAPAVPTDLPLTSGGAGIPGVSIPTVPDVPTAPNVPAVPNAPAVPAVPDVPAVPAVPDVPAAPSVPGLPASLSNLSSPLDRLSASATGAADSATAGMNGLRDRATDSLTTGSSGLNGLRDQATESVAAGTNGLNGLRGQATDSLNAGTNGLNGLRDRATNAITTGTNGLNGLRDTATQQATAGVNGLSERAQGALSSANPFAKRN